MDMKELRRFNSLKSIASWTNDSINQSYTAFLNASFMKERKKKEQKAKQAKRNLNFLSQSTKSPNKKKLPLPVISPLPQFRTISPKIRPICSTSIHAPNSKLREYNNLSNCCSLLLPRFTFKCIKSTKQLMSKANK